MSFWEFMWFLFVTWAFVAYLMVMFRIIADIFRDRDSSGWTKAFWCLALVIVPFITAIVYLGVKGRAMAERSIQAAEIQRKQQDAYIRDVAGHTTTPTDQIAQARGLLDSGAISQAEYDTLKTKALATV